MICITHRLYAGIVALSLIVQPLGELSLLQESRAIPILDPKLFNSEVLANRGLNGLSSMARHLQATTDHAMYPPISNAELSSGIPPLIPFDTRVEEREFLDHLGINSHSHIVTIGPYMPVQRVNIKNGYDPIRWEQEGLRRGAQVTVFEPDETANEAWRTMAKEHHRLNNRGQLIVPPAKQSYFEDNSLPDASVDLMLISGVLSDPYITLPTKIKILASAAHVMKDQSCLVISAYRTYETPADIQRYVDIMREQSIAAVLKETLTAEMRQALTPLLALEQMGVKLYPIGMRADRQIFPHINIAFKIMKKPEASSLVIDDNPWLALLGQSSRDPALLMPTNLFILEKPRRAA